MYALCRTNISWISNPLILHNIFNSGKDKLIHRQKIPFSIAVWQEIRLGFLLKDNVYHYIFNSKSWLVGYLEKGSSALTWLPVHSQQPGSRWHGWSVQSGPFSQTGGVTTPWPPPVSPGAEQCSSSRLYYGAWKAENQRNKTRETWRQRLDKTDNHRTRWDRETGETDIQRDR